MKKGLFATLISMVVCAFCFSISVFAHPTGLINSEPVYISVGSHDDFLQDAAITDKLTDNNINTFETIPNASSDSTTKDIIVYKFSQLQSLNNVMVQSSGKKFIMRCFFTDGQYILVDLTNYAYDGSIIHFPTINNIDRVTFHNNTGSGAPVAEIDVFYVEPPTDLVTSASDSKVDLSWQDGNNAEGTTYTVKRSAAPEGPYTTVAENVYGTTFTDMGVVNASAYYYVVSAVTAVGAESDNSNEASATPQPSPRALLTITMMNGNSKEYDLSASEINSFIQWYDNKASGSGLAYYIFNKDDHLGPFSSRKDYIIFDKIVAFEVNAYDLN